MSDFQQGLLIIYVSHDDGETWEMVEPARVPDWLKEPNVMARLVAGEMAKNRDVGLTVKEELLPWYRASKFDSSGETVN